MVDIRRFSTYPAYDRYGRGMTQEGRHLDVADEVVRDVVVLRRADVVRRDVCELVPIPRLRSGHIIASGTEVPILVESVTKDQYISCHAPICFIICLVWHNRNTLPCDILSESSMKWMSGRTTRRCDRAPSRAAQAADWYGTRLRNS